MFTYGLRRRAAPWIDWRVVTMAEENARENSPLPPETPAEPAEPLPATDRPKEIGGPKGPEPTRYGDWEKAGRCIDF